MQRKVSFANDEYYHVFNRGVDKRTIYMQPADYKRFLLYLYACNDSHPLVNTTAVYRGEASINDITTPRNPYVNVLCFCMMPNHFHLLLQQRVDMGIPKFMQKLSTAYTMYFNRKYNRSGVLLQGPFKAAHVEEESYFLHLSRYIHLNPLDLTHPQWRDEKIKNLPSILRHLLAYPWSSYADYAGHERYEQILHRALLRGMIPSPAQYRKFVLAWAAKDAHVLPEVALDT